MKHDSLCPCDDPQPVKHSHGTATYVQGWVTCRCELIKQARETAIKDCIAAVEALMPDLFEPCSWAGHDETIAALSSLLEGET